MSVTHTHTHTHTHIYRVAHLGLTRMPKRGRLSFEPDDVPAEIWHMLPNTDSRNPGIGYQADNAAAERFFATRVPESVGRAGCVCGTSLGG